MTEDMPQNSWAPITTSTITLAVVAPRASMKIWTGGSPVAEATVAA